MRSVRACGETRVSADLGQDTSRRAKAGPAIHRAARGGSYTPPKKSGCFGPAVTTTGGSTKPRASLLARCETDLAYGPETCVRVSARTPSQRGRRDSLCPGTTSAPGSRKPSWECCWFVNPEASLATSGADVGSASGEARGRFLAGPAPSLLFIAADKRRAVQLHATGKCAPPAPTASRKKACALRRRMV